jgi:ribonuclease Z
MEIVLLGTGSPIPDANRAGPATLIKAGSSNEEHLLIDAGRACVMRMTAARSSPAALRGILITHLHSDHLTDLNDLITTHWIMSRKPTVLRIWGPTGIKHYVDHVMQALSIDIGYRVGHHGDLTWEPQLEVLEVSAGDVFDVGSMSITVGSTLHAPVEPTIGYRVVGDGKTVAMAGDTIPCEGLDALCEGADAYVQTVIRDDLVKKIPSPRMQDILDYHSTVVQAAETAARNGVKQLVLTHYVPAPTPEQYPEWIALAAEHFDGKVIMGDDLTTVTV